MWSRSQRLGLADRAPLEAINTSSSVYRAHRGFVAGYRSNRAKLLSTTFAIWTGNGLTTQQNSFHIRHAFGGSSVILYPVTCRKRNGNKPLFDSGSELASATPVHLLNQRAGAGMIMTRNEVRNGRRKALHVTVKKGKNVGRGRS
jgi:hypothetical protein